jgi:hypothetical protein
VAYRRIVTTATAAAFLTACTSSVPVRKTEAVEQKEFYRHRMRLHLTSGEELMTKRMSVTDSTVTIYVLGVEGKTIEQKPPLVIPMSEVESIERIQFDDAKTIGACIFLALPIIGLLWIASNFDWEDES